MLLVSATGPVLPLPGYTNERFAGDIEEELREMFFGDIQVVEIDLLSVARAVNAVLNTTPLDLISEPNEDTLRAFVTKYLAGG